MSKYNIIIPTDIKPFVTRYEFTAATLLSKHFKADVEFISRSNQKTPDFLIKGTKWELKSPTGKGKHNVQHQLKAAAKQSSNVVFDARQSKMHMRRLRNQVTLHFRYAKRVKRLILIDKAKNVVELSK